MLDGLLTLRGPPLTSAHFEYCINVYLPYAPKMMPLISTGATHFSQPVVTHRRTNRGHKWFWHWVDVIVGARNDQSVNHAGPFTVSDT